MERFRKTMRRILFPGKAVMIPLTILSAVLLTSIFAFDFRQNIFAYLSYMLSAYTMMIICLKASKQIKKGIDLIESKSQHVNRYLNDILFRTHVSLYTSLALNSIYAIVKFWSGIVYHSFWFGSIPVYYFCLAIMRFMLLRHANRNAFGEDQIAEYKKYRICGAVLMVLNLALTGMVILVVTKNYTYRYPGNMIYAMGAYAFYNIITAIINVVKFRKQNSPTLSAAKVINLASALVSMLALETAMISQFGSEESPLFRRAMTSATGAFVCLVVLSTAVYMIVRATKNLKRLQQQALND